MVFERVRRGLARFEEVTLATAVPPAIEGRPDDYRLAPAKLIEDPELRHRLVGVATPCPEPLAFLDGTQRTEVVGYVGPVPVVAAAIGAAVRRREAGHLTTVIRSTRRIMVSSREGLALTAEAAPGFDLVALEDQGGEVRHPLKALEDAHRAVDRERSALERSVGADFRAQCSDWLVVDGVISDAEHWARDPKVIGVSKSHATLPFDGTALTTYLTLPAGHRTSIFEPATWRFAAPHSWGLRLWPYERRDLMHGLVRIEVAAGRASPEDADELSRWILAERAPLSRPDPRWDRLLYGVATVERHLRAAQ